MSIKEKISPEDFRTDCHYYDTFNNRDTEVSARWVIMFLQDRGQGWVDFPESEIKEFYGSKRLSAGNTDDGFLWNRLISGIHSHMTARNFPHGEIRDNDDSIRIVEGVCTVTDKFVQKLAAADIMV